MSRLIWTLPASAAITLMVMTGLEAQNDEERAVIAAAEDVFDAMEALDEEAFRISSPPTSRARRAP